jgi:Mg/Co/Ni transporter MgtE
LWPHDGGVRLVRMSKIKIDEADQLTVRDIVHAKLSAVDASSTIADVRAYFAASTSRRQAFVVDDGRYVGSLTPADLEGADPDSLAADVAQRDGPTIGLDAPATTGRDLALLTDRRRVPVLDDDGKLVGVVAVTGDLTSFCGTSSD